MTTETDDAEAIAGANLVYEAMVASKKNEIIVRANHMFWADNPAYQRRLKELMLVRAVEEFVARMPTRRI